jgi:cytochrome c oxidase cbb3-type subunit IV
MAQGECEAAPSLIEINGSILAPCKHDGKSGAASEMDTMDMTIYLLILIAAFVGIVAWAFGRKRKARFEKDARIPFDGKP